MTDDLTYPHIQRRVLMINDLPDDVVLEIFDFYMFRHQFLDLFQSDFEFDIRRKVESWQSLVHVCRRWRSLVFESPRRLNLQLCRHTHSKFANESLDIWPALPLLLFGTVSVTSEISNAIAELEHSNRICQIKIRCYEVPIKKLWTAMQVPFPELTGLYLSFEEIMVEVFGVDSIYGSVLPDSFLGGSAPRLQSFYLKGIPFPGLPKLLLSAPRLVTLHLHEIPDSGYISPEAMATCLSMLTSLETFDLSFEPSQTYLDPKYRQPLPPTRFVLPSLTKLWFEGVIDYLEEFVARIDAPQLDRFLTQLSFNDIYIKVPELNHFFCRTPALGACNEAHLTFSRREARADFCQSGPKDSDFMTIKVRIFSYWRLPTLVQTCTLSSLLVLTMEKLYIIDVPEEDHGIKNTEWLDLLRPFTAVKNLYLSETISPAIALALQGLAGQRTTEVLPALKTIFIPNSQPPAPLAEGIAQFVSARQLTNHPVTISVWD